MKTLFIPSFEIWNKSKFSYLSITETTEDILLFLVYLCKLSA